MDGYIKMYRQITHNPLWDDKPFTRGQAWIDLLLMANYQDNKVLLDGEFIEVKAGQRITSLRKLADRWGWSVPKVSRFLTALEVEKMLMQKRDTKKTLLTITNYELYQNGVTPKKHKKNTEKTQKNTNNKEKKDNKENNIYCQHLSMTQDEYQKLIVTYGEAKVNDKLEFASNWTKLKNYKSLYLTLNNWLKKDNGGHTDGTNKSNVIECSGELIDLSNAFTKV
jgi:DNA replication protein DnaD